MRQVSHAIYLRQKYYEKSTSNSLKPSAQDFVKSVTFKDDSISESTPESLNVHVKEDKLLKTEYQPVSVMTERSTPSKKRLMLKLKISTNVSTNTFIENRIFSIISYFFAAVLTGVEVIANRHILGAVRVEMMTGFEKVNKRFEKLEDRQTETERQALTVYREMIKNCFTKK